MDRSKFDEVVTSASELNSEFYSDILFENCRFFEQDWRGKHFQDCCFFNCSLELTEMEGVQFTSVHFEESKIVGAQFHLCSRMLLEISFAQSILISCNFSGLCLVKSLFYNTDFRECYFEDCDLKESNFSGSSFKGSSFHNTNLMKANLKDAREYEIDPRTNNLKKAIFSFPEAMGLLRSFDIKIVG